MCVCVRVCVCVHACERVASSTCMEAHAGCFILVPGSRSVPAASQYTVFLAGSPSLSRARQVPVLRHSTSGRVILDIQTMSADSALLWVISPSDALWKVLLPKVSSCPWCHLQ